MNKIIDTAELVKLKYDVMLRRIDDLKNVFSLLSHVIFSTDELNSQILGIPALSLVKLEEIKEQYIKMFDKMMESQVYQKYLDIEKAIMPYLAQLDNKLSQYVYYTKANIKEIMFSILDQIALSENFQDFKNIEEVLIQISSMQELLKRYQSYLSSEILEELQKTIITAKFNCLLTAQVELIVENKR